jgi:O-antigen/teichoic acid export membrane protein
MRTIVPDTLFDLNLVRLSTASELLPYCFGLTVMSFSMLLVTGLDLIVVGRFQFSAVAAYSVAASMVTFIAGGLYAALNAMMPHAATVHARQKPQELGSLVIVSTQIAIILLVFTSIPVLIYAAPILKVWIGQRYVQTGYPILAVLLIANIIRLIGAPYATVLVSAGQQRLIKISPLTEGISNLLASLVLGSILGAIGVALGTLVGSVFGVAAHILYSMPRTDAEIRISRRRYLVSGVITPFLATIPLLLAAAFSMVRMPATGGLVILLVAAALSLPGSALVLKHSGVLRI